MQIIYGHESLTEPIGPLIMTIGTYDGLHVGHRALIRCVVDRARKTGLRSLVYSFFPPPWRTLGRPQGHPFLILNLADKAALIEELGVDYLLTERFGPHIQELTPWDFATGVLQNKLHAREVHVGYDFAFGKGRGGDWRFLDRVLGPGGTEVRPHGAVRWGDAPVGCRRIRSDVAEGRLDAATAQLVRYHFISGVVVRGRARGRTIGFPTANVQPATELVPQAGVYAVQMRIGDEQRWRPGVANLGYRPTFDEQDFSVEVHLLEAPTESLYGERVQVGFVSRIRGERRFDSADQLVEQIRRDTATARALFPLAPLPEPELSWDPKPVDRGPHNG